MIKNLETMQQTVFIRLLMSALWVNLYHNFFFTLSLFLSYSFFWTRENRQFFNWVLIFPKKKERKKKEVHTITTMLKGKIEEETRRKSMVLHMLDSLFGTSQQISAKIKLQQRWFRFFFIFIFIICSTKKRSFTFF